MLSGSANDGRFQRVFSEVSAAVRASGSERAITQAFSGLGSNEQRVAFLLSSPIIRPALTIPARPAAARASVKDARALREDGNDKFKRKQFAEAQDAYSRSILRCSRDVAAADGESLECVAVCYANRSAAWYHLGELDCCLSDIAAAAAHGYPKRLLHKLHERKARCLLGLGGAAAAAAAAAAEAASDALEALAFAELSPADEDSFRRGLSDVARACSGDSADGCSQPQWQQQQPSPLAPADAGTVRRERTTDASSYAGLCRVPELASGSNPAYPALSALVDVDSSERHGRHVVAKVKVDVGDVILVEEPFAAVLSPDCVATHCYGCLVRFKAFYPCRRCTVALYCSLRCEEASWTAYHRFECDRVVALVGCGIAMGHLALRAALVGGLTYYCSSSSSNAAGEVRRLEAMPIDEATLRCYADVFRLESHEADRSAVDLFWRSLAAVYLALCAGPDTVQLLPPGWRRSQAAAASDEDLLVALAAVVLHHLQVFPCNAHEISELRGVAGAMQNSELAEIGAGIYASLSLFNHSCDPGVTRTFNGRTAVVRCLRPLAAGEQAYDNYGVVYATHSLTERRAKLLKQYYFECACAACAGDWPLYEALLGSAVELQLQPCLHRRPALPAASASTGARCPDCTDRARAVDCELRQCLAAVCGGGDEGCRGDVARRLADCLESLYGLVAKPYKAFNDCEEALKHCFNRAGNCHVFPGPAPRHA